MNVKKILINTVIIIVILTGCFLGGYSYGRYKYNAIDTESSTKLIREQSDTIKTLRTELATAITTSDTAINTATGIKDGIDNIGNDIGEVADGLQPDIEGLQSVIDRLRYYQNKAEN